MQSLALQTRFQTRKLTIIRRLALGIALVALAMLFLPAKQSYAVDREHWMSQLDQNLKVSQLTIPGTHDSATFWLKGAMCDMAQCQSRTFEEQLSAGIRAFDLRYDYDSGKFTMYHGDTQPFSYVCHERNSDKELRIDDVLNKFSTFLKTHSNEFIIINMQRERGTSGKVVDDALQAMYKKYNVYQNRTNYTTISDVKGKIVLGSDFMQSPGENSPYNRYKGSVQQKINDMKEVFSTAPLTSKKDASAIIQKVTYTNLSWRFELDSPATYGPSDYAKRVHERFFNDNPFQKYQTSKADEHRAYGVVLYDYPSDKMLDETIEANDWAKA